MKRLMDFFSFFFSRVKVINSQSHRILMMTGWRWLFKGYSEGQRVQEWRGMETFPWENDSSLPSSQGRKA